MRSLNLEKAVSRFFVALRSLRRLLNSMNQEALETRNDWCILQLAKHLYNKYGSRVKMHEYIRQKMRELGRLLICAREVSPLTSIKELIHPTNFMHTINAVKRAAGYDEQSNVYEKASVAVKLGHSLNKIAMLIESHSTIAGDEETGKVAKSFRVRVRVRLALTLTRLS